MSSSGEFPATGSFRLASVMSEDAPPVEAAILTLLTSDLVGSTRLVERLGDQRAAEIFERHDRLARDLVVRCRGLEIDRTDGFLMVFERPVEAVSFALHYHEALAALGEELGEALAARVGIHLGEVVLKRNAAEDVARGAKLVEVEGLAKPIVTRLGNLAQGGQTLLTHTAFDLARRAAVDGTVLPPGLSWLAHGPYRFSGVEEPVEVYEVGHPELAPLAPPPDSEKARRLELRAPLRWQRLLLIATTAALLGLLVVAGWFVWLQRENSTEVDAAAMREGLSANAPVPAGADLVARRVMVVPFENRTGDKQFDSLSVIIADWLSQGLSRAGSLDIVPMDLAVRSTRYVEGQNGQEEDADPGAVDLFAVAEDTGAGTIVSGAYYRRGDELIVRGQITDAIGGKMLSGIETLRTPVDDPLGVLEELEQAVRTGVASHLDPQLAQFGNLVTRPPSYEAYEAYVAGMERYWRLDFDGSIEPFEEAAKLAPEFATPQLVAASAHLNLGRFSEVQRIVNRLNEQRTNLAPQDRFYLDWLEARCRGDRLRAVQVARQAVELSPGSSWAEILGVDALQADQPALAAAVLAPLDVERGYLRGWTSHFFYLTSAWHHLGDHSRELQDARRGRQLYPTSLHTVLCEARALAALGREDELFALLERAESYPREFVTSPGSAMTFAALELEAHSHPNGAKRAAEMAVDWFHRQSPEVAAEPLYREGLGRALFASENFDEAEGIFAELSRENPQQVDYLGFWGLLATIQGNPEAPGLLESLEKLDRPYLFGKHLYWQAAILAWRGDHEEAVRRLRQAVAEGRPFEWPELHPHMDPVWRPLRNDPTFLDLIQPRG